MRLLPGNNIGYFGPYESMLRAGFPRGHMGSCGAGCSTLGIEADGAIKGCPSLQTDPWTGGNIRDASLRDIWERSAPLRFMRDRTVDDLWGYCRTCYYADVCRAGCTWTGFSLFGKPGNNPLCHHRALEMHARRAARAAGAGRARARRAVRSRAVRDRRGGDRVMSQLAPCPACNRHVAIGRRGLPVLRDGAARAASARRERGRELRGRLSRAALFAAGATLMGLSACTDAKCDHLTCSAGMAGTSGGGTGGSAGASGGTGGTSGSAGTSGTAGNDGGTDAVSPTDGPVAIYSAVFPPGL